MWARRKSFKGKPVAKTAQRSENDWTVFVLTALFPPRVYIREIPYWMGRDGLFLVRILICYYLVKTMHSLDKNKCPFGVHGG